MRKLSWLLPVLLTTTLSACGAGVDEDTDAAADVGPVTDGKSDSLSNYGDSLVGAYRNDKFAVPSFHAVVLFADGHFVADQYVYHVDCIPGPCRDARTTGKWSAGKTYLRLGNSYYAYTAVEKNGSVSKLSLRKTHTEVTQAMVGESTYCVDPTDCGGQPMPLLGCRGMHFTCGQNNVCGQSCTPPPPKDSCGGCGDGQSCQFCWGKFACIPKGALC